MNFKKSIIEHHMNLGYKIGADGYVGNEKDNLLEKYPNWKEIKGELENGDGNEFKPDSSGRAKFMAVHSSCALCVNNFALIKYHKNNVTLFGSSGFIKAEFEKKFPTSVGKRPANLDFYLENKKMMIGIESKFSEPASSKLPNAKANLTKYHNHQKLLENLDPRFNEIIKFCIDCNEKLHLDAAQLIKHLIALSLASINNNNKKAKLVYLYWVPLNHKKIEIYQKHEEELKTFKDQIKSLPITFESCTYIEFWKMMEKNVVLSDIVKKIKKRYEFEV